MIAAATFGIIAYLAGNAFSRIPRHQLRSGVGELAVMCGAMIGAGLGFLWFMRRRRKSSWATRGLWLWGHLGAIAVAMKHEIVSAIVGGLFVMEAFSVIVQVASFKLTGKRVFKMAPINHHFSNWAGPSRRSWCGSGSSPSSWACLASQR